MTKPLPDAALLAELLDYQPETGLLFWRPRAREHFGSDREWKRWNTRYAGREAFTAVDGEGYRRGSIFGSPYLAQRIIWKMQTGRDPPDDVDHDDRDRLNNRWGNLRAKTRAQNCHNQKLRNTNKSGVMGVHFDTASGKWKAQIRNGGRNIHLGLYDTLAIAKVARKAAEKALGYHPNHGRKAA